MYKLSQQRKSHLAEATQPVRGRVWSRSQLPALLTLKCSFQRTKGTCCQRQFTTDTPTISHSGDSEEIMCFSQSSPGWTLTELALFQRGQFIPPGRLTLETGRRRGREGRMGEEGRENYFGLFSPELKNKQITYRYYANVSITCQKSTAR